MTSDVRYDVNRLSYNLDVAYCVKKRNYNYLTASVFVRFACAQAILRFWLDKGVDGFRVVGSAFLFESPDLRNETNICTPEVGFLLIKSIAYIYSQGGA